jgi:hypothetical protein
MSWRLLLALVCVPTVLAFDALLIRRMLTAWQRAHRSAHLYIIAGTAMSFVLGLAGAALVVLELDPSGTDQGAWTVLRATLTLATGVSIACVALFGAAAFREHVARAQQVARVFALLVVGLTVLGLVLEPADVPSPATWSYGLRLPLVALNVCAFGWVALAALRTHASLAEAQALGRDTNPLVLRRMQVLGRGSALAALGQVTLLLPGVHARIDGDALGWTAMSASLLGALAFVTAIFLTWATPPWVRDRWLREARVSATHGPLEDA